MSKVPESAIEQLDFDQSDDSVRVVEAKGAVGTLQGVPFFAAPNGEDLAKVMLPFVKQAL